MKLLLYKISFLKKMFIVLSSACTIGRFCASLTFNSIGPIKCVPLNNQPCRDRLTLVNINSDETLFVNLLPVLISVVEVVAL